MNVHEYIKLLTSQHRNKPKLNASVVANIKPIIDIKETIDHFSDYFNLETAVGDQLITIAKWAGAPTTIPDVIPLPYFGFEGQPEALPFGDTDDPEIGGFWRESGVSGSAAAVIEDDLLRRVIRAQIYKNQCGCSLHDAYTILQIVLDNQFNVIDMGDMYVGLEFESGTSLLSTQLAKVMTPKPMGVEVGFIEY